MANGSNLPLADKGNIFDHPPQLFVLFFTEMWERFSYYGMRALFVLFLTATLLDGGFEYSKEFSLELYGIYTGLVYFTPLIGGVLADRLLGYRNAVVLGAFTMTMGHASLAFETPFFFYLGCLLLIIGNGLFKPNISSIVGQLYDDEERKDGAYTIFYMGINAGAFLGILLCGYIGEKVGWSWGFGLAGVFMFFGMLQFYFAQSIFGKIGLSPKATKAFESANAPRLDDQLTDEALPKIDSQDGARALKWGGIGLVLGIGIYLLTDYYNGAEDIGEWMAALIFGAVVAFIGWIMSDPDLQGKERDRVWVIVILSFFIIFFWWAFEQAGGSMTVFARDYTDRTLTGGSATTFKIANALLTVGPMIVITYVLYKLFSITFKNFAASNLFLGTSFVIIWGIIIWMLYREFVADTTEVQASWFGILNSFFIITLAPLFSKFWEAKIITSGPLKFSLGLILLGIGFAILSYGSMGIPQGAETAAVSMVWLILAYLFHTMGELCLSPVGLSYVSKLAPVRLVGLMFGVFFVANFVANYAAGKTGSYIEVIVETYNMSTFFLIFTLIPIGAGIVLILINPILKRMMHGVE
jgi:POT family proton-dependent oligopeptide transporter